MPWIVRVPRLRIDGYDEYGPFEVWGQAESERMGHHQSIPATINETSNRPAPEPTKPVFFGTDSEEIKADKRSILPLVRAAGLNAKCVCGLYVEIMWNSRSMRLDARYQDKWHMYAPNLVGDREIDPCRGGP